MNHFKAARSPLLEVRLQTPSTQATAATVSQGCTSPGAVPRPGGPEVSPHAQAGQPKHSAADTLPRAAQPSGDWNLVRLAAERVVASPCAASDKAHF